MTGTVSVKTYFGSVVSSNGSGGYVIDCSSKADITVTGKGMVGGIAGQNYENGTVKDCLNAGDISANAEDAGGITGRNFGTISSSFTSGNVTLAAYSNSTGYGGICAYNSGAITGTYYDRGQFPGDGIGDGDKVDYTCGVYPWEINGVEIDGWGSAQVTNDSGDTSKKRTTEYSLPYPNGASTANKTSILFRFETKDGSAWKSYTSITTADELKAISNNLDGSYVLETDITLSGDWAPLGMNYGSRFTGCFDGSGPNIKGLNVNEPSDSYQGYGLFGYVTGSVVDVNVEGNVRAMKSIVGGIVGLASGGTEISVCYSSGSVNNNPTVTNCIFAGKVKYKEGPHGGISGQEGGSYTNCYYLSGSFDSGNYDTKDGTALSPVELALLTADVLSDAWESGSVGTDLTEADSKYHTYKMGCTFPKLSKMAKAVTGSAEFYNFGIDGDDDYRAFTAIKTVDDLKNIEKDVTGNYVIMADELDASGMEMLCDHGNKFAGKLAGNGCKLTLSKPLFEYNSGLVMGINAAGTIDGSSEYRYGAIARENSGGTIYGCSFSGSLTAFDYAGGICYIVNINGKVTSCYNIGALSAQSTYGISVTSDDKIQNSYYLSAEPGNDNNAKTAKAFASGEVAYLLNGDQSTIAWGQEIGKNSYPVPGGMRVYVSSPCMSIFTNDNSGIHREHKFGDWVTTKEPTYTSTGVKTRTCSICGAAEEDTIPKKSGSSSGGSSGGGSSRPSGGSSSTSDSKPSINGKQKSWSDISSDIAKLPAGGSATINTNGETNVPADVIKSIKDSKTKVELIIDSTRSWIIDGLRISKVSAADLSTLPGNADRSTLRGTSGADLKITGTRVPADLKLKFRKEFASQFANFYKLTDGKLVFQNCVKVDENGAAIIPGADTNGEYIVMVCEFSDRLGDMNNDGVLNALDASAILKSIIGAANGANPQMADFNGDGKVNAFDASAILKWMIAA